jgi:hypothetical protein
MSFFTAYFDDSGTHRESSIAVASCLVASVDQWDAFSRNWAEAERAEGFGAFHMADFAFGERQFKGWGDGKKERVLARLCNLISTRVQIGWSVAISKRDYDKIIVGPFRDWCGQFHYTFCVRQCAGSVGLWRRESQPQCSLKYVFDRVSQGKGDIMFAMDCAVKNSEIESRSTGVKPLGGYSFESKADVWPLQAADIYAWTSFQQMQRIVSRKRRVSPWADLSYRLLRLSHCPLRWHYYVEDNLRPWAAAESEALIEKIRGVRRGTV